jgi:hypothetical protein
MTAAYRLKGIGWFGGCVVVALGFYLVSLQVAAERKKLEQTDARIRVAMRDIRALETEFDTRANLTQLERWNGDTLALVAPGANQFVRDEAQLAAVRFDVAPRAIGGSVPVRTASLVVPSYTSPVVGTVTAPAAAASAAAPVTVKVAAVASARAPTMTKVAAVAPAARMMPAVVTVAKAAPVKRQAVAMLLSDATLGDLVRSARSEARTLR